LVFSDTFYYKKTPGAAIPFLVMKEFERIQEGSQVQLQAPKDKSDEISDDGFAYSNALKLSSSLALFVGYILTFHCAIPL
jgi:hypothetical protein